MSILRNDHLALCLLTSLVAGQGTYRQRCRGELSSNFTTGSNIQVERDMISTIVQLIQTLEWHRIILLYDQQSYSTVRGILLHMDLYIHPVSFLLQELKLSESSFKEFLHSVHQRFFPELKIILLTDHWRANMLLKIVDSADSELNRTTDFRHYSFWIQACTSVCQPPPGPHPGIRHLENVILLSPEEERGINVWSLEVTNEGRKYSNLQMPVTLDEKRNIFINTKFGLNNRTLIVATLTDQEKIYFTKTEKGYEGYSIEIIQCLASALNFSYEIIEPADRKWGSQTQGTWNGLVGQLQRREVDMVIAPLTIHEDRERVMDFLYPPFKTAVDGFAYMVPSNEFDRWKIYLRNFRAEVLYVLLATFAVFILLAWLMMMSREQDMSPFSRGNHVEQDKASCFLQYVIGFMINQGSSMKVQYISTRILFFSWGIFGVILAAAYSANLVAIFAVHKQPLPFTSLDGLVRQKEYKWGSIGGNIRKHIFQMSKESNMKLAWEGILEFYKNDPDVLNKSAWTHFNKARREKYVFFANIDMLYRLKEYDCRLNVVGEGIIWHQYGVGVPAGSPLSKDIERVLSMIADSGLLELWWKKWGERNLEKCVEDNKVSPLTIHDVSSAFYILCAGFGLAVLVFLAEKMRSTRNRNVKGSAYAM